MMLKLYFFKKLTNNGYDLINAELHKANARILAKMTHITNNELQNKIPLFLRSKS